MTPPGHWRATSIVRVLMFLAEKNISGLEVINIDLNKGDHRAPGYLAKSPLAKVPALELDDGRVLTEVAGCLFYLARTYPAAGLLPVNDPEAEAQVVSWMSFIASAIHPARTAGMDRAREVWQIADQRLGKNDWAVGGRYSIADMACYGWVFSQQKRDPKVLDGFANVKRWVEAIKARPATIAAYAKGEPLLAAPLPTNSSSRAAGRRIRKSPITSVSMWVRRKQLMASSGRSTMGSLSLNEVLTTAGTPVTAAASMSAPLSAMIWRSVNNRHSIRRTSPGRA